jgi:hypothetical protein
MRLAVGTGPSIGRGIREANAEHARQANLIPRDTKVRGNRREAIGQGALRSIEQAERGMR